MNTETLPAAMTITVARPTLEYCHAFDLCVVEACCSEQPILCLASSAFYARELLRRLRGREVALIPVGGWSADLTGGTALWGADVENPPIHSLDGAPIGAPTGAPTLIWAEPLQADSAPIFARLRDLVPPPGRLLVIASGALAVLLPGPDRAGSAARAGSADGSAGQLPLGWRRTVRRLEQTGFHVEAVYGFHGPVSILWAYAFRVMGLLRRGDLADRCLYRMRAAYTVQGWERYLTTLTVIAARPAGGRPHG